MNNEYHAFLLRLQRDDAQNRWRIVLINVDTGEEQRFVGKQALLTFLFALLNRPPVVPDTAEPEHPTP
ncbi:MAG: hypothetical protein KDD89_09160 [Anaerolineales bacterium]|nr:hypothetical protein [Anaerolineales bacterium]